MNLHFLYVERELVTDEVVHVSTINIIIDVIHLFMFCGCAPTLANFPANSECISYESPGDVFCLPRKLVRLQSNS